MDASRDFVCIQLATYEDQSEADFMKELYVGKSGFVENTMFAILGPDGKKELTKKGRAPFHEYRNARDMARGMKEIAGDYADATAKDWSGAPIPFSASVKLGVNVASADMLPLVVVTGTDSPERDSLKGQLQSVVWSPEIVGRFTYAQTQSVADLELVTDHGVEDDSTVSVLVIEPGRFGLSGKVLKRLEAEATKVDIQAALTDVVNTFQRPNKPHDAHVREGVKLGIDWKTKTPITDPEALQTRKRWRGE